jgi:two-component system, NarL family, response regulator DegU
MHKIVVMIIDSEPFFRAGLRQALSPQEGLEILECDPEAEGKTAIAQISASSPDVALLDIGYPTLLGLDLGKKIARSFPITKVVMLSANPNEDDDELFEVIKSGAVAYLRSKDCTPTRLIDTIRRASHGEYPINDSVSSRPKVAWRVLRQFQDIAAMGMTIEDITTPLTSKEVQILTHIAEGNTNKRIASLLGISEQTIKNHVSAILRKLNANDRAHAVFLALRNGWISIEVENNGKHQEASIPLGSHPDHPL